MRNANVIGFLHIVDVDVLLVGFRSLQPSIKEYGQTIDLQPERRRSFSLLVVAGASTAEVGFTEVGQCSFYRFRCHFVSVAWMKAAIVVRLYCGVETVVFMLLLLPSDIPVILVRVVRLRLRSLLRSHCSRTGCVPGSLGLRLSGLVNGSTMRHFDYCCCRAS